MAKKKKKKQVKSKNKLKLEAVVIEKKVNESSKTGSSNMVSWGDQKFKVNSNELTALSDLDISDSYSDEYNDKGKKVGRELATFSINVTYFTPKAGSLKNARSAYQRWRSRLGKSHYLYVGGTKIFKRKCILVGVSGSNIRLTNRGQMIAVDVQLDFKWARTKKEEKAAKAEAKSSGSTKSGSSGSGSSSSSSKSSGGAGSYDGGKMQWPLPGHKRISSNYGPRNCPYHGRETHSGIDIPAPGGTAIKAAAAGTVVLAGRNGSYGNCVILSHGKSIYTLYGHASSVVVKKGQSVKAGQTIAKVGSTGNSTGNHLHFEVRKGGNSHRNHTSPWNYVSK